MRRKNVEPAIAPLRCYVDLGASVNDATAYGVNARCARKTGGVVCATVTTKSAWTGGGKWGSTMQRL